jgi:AcrR family transcriptional regulator
MEQVDNRSNILKCALTLFTARGYDAVGIQEIVETAHVTKPTLYHYFGSKFGLLEALTNSYSEGFYNTLKSVTEYKRDLTLSLTKIVGAYFKFAKENPTFYRLQLSLWFAPPDSEPYKVVTRWHEMQYELIEELFKEAANQHGNMRGRQRPYAATFLGMINNYISLALNGYTELDDALIYQAVHQFMHGIFS